MNLSLVGDDSSGSDSVQCHTDLSTCCTKSEGPHRGDWYFPGGTTRLPFSGDIYEARRTQRVELHHRNNANSPVGIYHCSIATIAVHHPTDRSVRDTVYVGLYIGIGMSLLLHALLAILVTLAAQQSQLISLLLWNSTRSVCVVYIDTIV